MKDYVNAGLSAMSTFCVVISAYSGLILVVADAEARRGVA